MKNYRYTVGFLVLVIVLGGPFTLRTIVPALEPYPALIMPGGSGMVTAENGAFHFTLTVYYGIDAQTGEERRIMPVDLITPAEVDYAERIAKQDFGLDPNQKTRIWFRRKFGIFKDRRISLGKVTDAEREEARQWLKQRMLDLGYDGRVLVVRRLRYRVDHETRSSTEVGIEREKVLVLD